MSGVNWNRASLPPLGLLWRYGGWWRWLILGLILGGLAIGRQAWGLGLGFLGSAAALTWFFRNPSRTIAADPASVVSPVDGLVDTLVITDGAPEIPGEVLRIGIFLSVLNVHATRAPITGIIRTTAALPGSHRSALSRDVGVTNQCNDVWMADAANRPLFLRQIAGAIARRVVFAPNPGDTVQRGAVVGMIRFGSRVELWLPVRDGYVATVWRGDRVRGGVSVVARVHPR